MLTDKHVSANEGAPSINDFDITEITEMLTDEVMLSAGSIDNLKTCRQADETKSEYMDRVYTEALDEVNDAVISIEESGDYDFSDYEGNPDTEWYDEARDEAVQIVMRWMTGEE